VTDGSLSNRGLLSINHPAISLANPLLKALCLVGWPDEVGRVEVILTGNPDKREESVAPGIGQRCAFPMWGLADRADRPIRGNPFSRGVGQDGRQIDRASGLVDGGRLHGSDLMLPQGLAHDVEPARQRGIANVWSALPVDWMVPVRDFSGLMSSTCALARAAAKLAIDSLDRCMVGLRIQEIEADGTRLRPLRSDTVTDSLLGVIGHKALKLGFGLFMLEMR